MQCECRRGLQNLLLFLVLLPHVGAGGRTGGAVSAATLRTLDAICCSSPSDLSDFRLLLLPLTAGCSTCVVSSVVVGLVAAKLVAGLVAGLAGPTACSSSGGLTQWLWRHLQSSWAASNFLRWSRKLSTNFCWILIIWLTSSAGELWRIESRLGRGRLHCSLHPSQRSRDDSLSRDRAGAWLSSCTTGALGDGADGSLVTTTAGSAGAVGCSLVGLAAVAVSTRAFWDDGILSDV